MPQSITEETRQRLASTELALDTGAAGEVWWRVHSIGRVATAFNDRCPDSTWAGGRFQPLVLSDGTVVPTLYAGATPDVALAETIFHDVPPGPGGFVPRQRLLQNLLTPLQVVKPLNLIKLYAPEARRLPILESALYHSLPSSYSQSRAWARLLYEAVPTAAGLVWQSNPLKTHRALVLFGTRLEPGSLEVGEAALPLSVGEGFGMVCRFAERAAIKIGSML